MRFPTHVLLSLILASVAAAQGPRAQEPETGQPVFEEEIHVRLVEVPILARDRQGRPVTDLRPDELVVKDRGQVMEVAFLEPFVETAPQEPLPDVRLKLDLPGGAETVAQAGEREPRYVIFYIDVENDQPLGKTQAAQDLIRLVSDELDDSYQVAVLSYGGTIELMQPFTNDRRAVTLAIRNAFDQPRRPQIDLKLRIEKLIGEIEDCVDDDAGFGAVERRADDSCLETVAVDYADEVRPRAEDFLTGLEALVRFAGGLDGRKSVIAVSHGVAVNPADEVVEAMKALIGNSPQLSAIRLELLGGEGARFALDDVIDLAIRSEVTLHFVDRTQAPSSDYGARQGRLLQPGAMPTLAAHQAAQTDLREIAATTGGLFLATTELYDGVRQAIDAERGGYFLGYYAERFLPRDVLGKVSIESTRKGVRISHRRGTYALPREGAEDVFRGRIGLGRPQKLPPERGDGLHVPFRIEVEPKDIGYEAAGDDLVATQFTVHVLVEEGSRQVAGSYHFVQHGYPKAYWDAGDVEPVTIDGWVEVPLGEYRLVARFTNAKTGRGGQLVQELEVKSRGDEPGGSP